MFDIELLMADMKMTQNELATVLGVSQTAISKVKNGKMDIPESWVDLLNEKYNVIITKYFKESNVINDPKEVYETNNINVSSEDKKEILMKSILNLSESNKILADSVHKAIILNEKMMEKIDLLWQNI